MTASGGTEVREHEAADLDTGRADVRPVLRRLGQVGAFGAAGADPIDELLPSVRLVRELATASLAAAFSVWSQRMVIEYLRCCPPPDSETDLAQALRTGEMTGASGLAPAISDLAGRAELPVVATPDGDGWRLSGTIGWASNLFDDAVVVTPARTTDEGRLVVLFRRTAPGVTPTPLHDLLGLNGTGTGALELDGVAVSRRQMLSDDLPDFMALCRPAMLLQQSALAVGLADAALEQAAAQLTGVSAVLRSEHEELAGRRDQVAIRLEDQAGSRVGIAPGDLARVRLDAMDVAARAVRLESAVSGGSGYLAGSGTARRVREAAFLPVQAPSEAQLRSEVAAAGSRDERGPGGSPEK
jgi:alkylation response protein AidB-like acyl-CoA dehydrogenase